MKIPHYPPRAEVEALWAACVPLRDDRRIASWMASEGWRVRHLELRDVARALPIGTPCPAWARAHGRDWSSSAYRILSPLVDAHGVLRSIWAKHVGRVRDTRPARRALLAHRAPHGHERRGLVLADARGAAALRGAPSAAVVITDGTDSLYRSETGAPALAALAGGWTEEHAASLARAGVSVARVETGATSSASIATSLEGAGIAAEIIDHETGRRARILDAERRHVAGAHRAPAVHDVARAVGRVALGDVCSDYGAPACPRCGCVADVSAAGRRWRCTGRTYGQATEPVTGSCASGDWIDFLAFHVAGCSLADLVTVAHGWGRPRHAAALTARVAASRLAELARRARALEGRAPTVDRG